MQKIEKEVLAWHKETFPNATEEAVFSKMFDEVRELSYAETDEELKDEIADVAITAIAFLDRIGSSLSEVVSHKLEINKARQWGPEDENGDRPRVK